MRLCDLCVHLICAHFLKPSSPLQCAHRFHTDHGSTELTEVSQTNYGFPKIDVGYFSVPWAVVYVSLFGRAVFRET